MARLTITLPDELHRALKQAAARRRRTIGDLIEESLGLYGVKDEETAVALVARARAYAAMDEREALKLAVGETRAARRR
jgi:predicted transcriptional regulator